MDSSEDDDTVAVDLNELDYDDPVIKQTIQSTMQEVLDQVAARLVVPATTEVSRSRSMLRAQTHRRPASFPLTRPSTSQMPMLREEPEEEMRQTGASSQASYHLEYARRRIYRCLMYPLVRNNYYLFRKIFRNKLNMNESTISKIRKLWDQVANKRSKSSPRRAAVTAIKSPPSKIPKLIPLYVGDTTPRDDPSAVLAHFKIRSKARKYRSMAQRSMRETSTSPTMPSTDAPPTEEQTDMKTKSDFWYEGKTSPIASCSKYDQPGTSKESPPTPEDDNDDSWLTEGSNGEPTVKPEEEPVEELTPSRQALKRILEREEVDQTTGLPAGFKLLTPPSSEPTGEVLNLAQVYDEEAPVNLRHGFPTPFRIQRRKKKPQQRYSSRRPPPPPRIQSPEQKVKITKEMSASFNQIRLPGQVLRSLRPPGFERDGVPYGLNPQHLGQTPMPFTMPPPRERPVESNSSLFPKPWTESESTETVRRRRPREPGHRRQQHTSPATPRQPVPRRRQEPQQPEPKKRQPSEKKRPTSKKTSRGKTVVAETLVLPREIPSDEKMTVVPLYSQEAQTTQLTLTVEKTAHIYPSLQEAIPESSPPFRTERGAGKISHSRRKSKSAERRSRAPYNPDNRYHGRPNSRSLERPQRGSTRPETQVRQSLPSTSTETTGFTSRRSIKRWIVRRASQEAQIAVDQSTPTEGRTVEPVAGPSHAPHQYYSSGDKKTRRTHELTSSEGRVHIPQQSPRKEKKNATPCQSPKNKHDGTDKSPPPPPRSTAQRSRDLVGWPRTL